MDNKQLLSSNYDRIAQSIDFIKRNFRGQPSLDQMAQEAGMSPFHFQRIFSEWAGVSPARFVQYLSVNYARQILKRPHASLFDATHETGLSGTGRLHDLFVKIEGMTPGSYKNGARGLTICYEFVDTLFGTALIASTDRGICHLSFFEDRDLALQELRTQFPEAYFMQSSGPFHQEVLQALKPVGNNIKAVRLHLRGTPFQLKVWQALLGIPLGGLSTYGYVSAAIGHPKASRAVGSAVGENPVAFLIPCHRVIRSGGQYGEYRWGSTRKSALIAWEAAQLERSPEVEYDSNQQ